MPVPNKNKSARRTMAVNRTAFLEQLIAQIDAAHRSAAASYHQSELAENSISNATATITEAVKSLALGDFDNVDRLHNVAWFYAKFAQDIVAAESTEHLLGNDRFFDLIEPQAKVQLQLQELLQVLFGKLDELEKRIPEFWELDDASRKDSREVD
ncbi:MAG: hypothetical protein JST01_19175 [Cyanobacteria bacterium SZAS TMP-1]|nr:hypothetical protein [Cyanobacteria bacterium SZAS TMP-1]